MKAKRLTALALAALMAASTTSVAFAGERTEYDLDFANDGYYKYNSDTNRLESAKSDEFQPGDDVYLRLKEDRTDAFNNKKTYNAYADWAIGDSWVKDIDVVYRKGDVIKTTTYDWKFTFDGAPYTGTGATKNDESTKQSLIDSKLTDEVKNSYKNKYWDTASGYVVNEKFFASVEEAAKAAGFEKRKESVDGQYTYNGRTGTLDELDLTAIPNSGYIYADVYDSTTDAVQVLKNLAKKDSPNNRWEKTEVYVDNASNSYGVVVGATGEPDQDKKTVYTVEMNDGVTYWWDDGNAENLLLNKLGVTKATSNGDYYINKGEKLGQVVKQSEVTQASGNEEAWYSTSRISYKTAADALKSMNITQQTYYVEKGKGSTNGEVGVVDADAKLSAAIADAKSTFVFTEKTSTEPQYEYWVKISTKDSATTKDIDVVGSIWVGTSKSSAKKEADGTEDRFHADFTLTNSNPEMDDEYSDYVSIEDGQPAVVKFADDASDEFEVEFGDDARFVFNARGQGKLNLAYNTKFNKEFAYDYDSANIDFITFEGEPTTNRTGTLYIYADEDSYIYEVTSKGAKKINGAYYDDDEGAWVIRTRHLTSYAISDKKLKTVDQMDGGSSSSGSSSGSQSGGGSGSGKPNPDTGR